MKDVRMMPLRAGTPHPPQTRHLVSPAGSVTLEGKQHSVVSDVRAPLCYLEEKADGSVSVFDGYKTVRFEPEIRNDDEEVNNPSVTASRATSLYTREAGHEVTIRMSDGVEPIEAARLYIEYLELIRSCPRYRTEKAVNCKDMGCLSLRESTPHPPQKRHLPLEGKAIEMKPKKIKIRILEGEKVV